MGRREQEKGEVMCLRRQDFLLKEKSFTSVIVVLEGCLHCCFALNWPHIISQLWVELIPLLPRWRWLWKQNSSDNPNSSGPGLAAAVCWHQVCICFCLEGSWCTHTHTREMVVPLLPTIHVEPGHTGNNGLLNGEDGTRCKTYGWLHHMLGIPPLCPAEKDSSSLRGQKYLNREKSKCMPQRCCGEDLSFLLVP